MDPYWSAADPVSCPSGISRPISAMSNRLVRCPRGAHLSSTSSHIYLYIYIYIHTYIYTYTNIHTYIYIYIYMHIYGHVHMYIYVYIHIVYACIYIYDGDRFILGCFSSQGAGGESLIASEEFWLIPNQFSQRLTQF